MNKIGTKGVDGTLVGTISTDGNGEFTETFAIPSGLRSENRIAIRAESPKYAWSYAYNWFENVTRGDSSSGGTSNSGAVISILKVVEDRSVRFQAERLPASTRFNVWLGWQGRQGNVTYPNAAVALYSDRDGIMEETLEIPRELRDRSTLVLRLETAGSSRVVATKWFVNSSSQDGSGSGSSGGFNNGAPTLQIHSVQQDAWVNLMAGNLPKRTKFVVLMGRMGTEGVDGIEVGEFKTDSQGQFGGSFEIPRKLQGKDRIAIRIEATDDSGVYAFTWFENKTTP
jgi:hypothetical protein